MYLIAINKIIKCFLFPFLYSLFLSYFGVFFSVFHFFYFPVLTFFFHSYCIVFFFFCGFLLHFFNLFSCACIFLYLLYASVTANSSISCLFLTVGFLYSKLGVRGTPFPLPPLTLWFYYL